MSIKEVPESVSEYVRSHFRYDPETGLLWRTKSYSKRTNLLNPVGSFNSQGYLDVDLGKGYGKRVRNTRVHRVAWFLTYGIWPTQQIDHVDGNKENNKLVNLRLVDHRKNQMNGFSKKDSSSRFKGVGKSKGGWRAYICLPGKKMLHLGYFEEEEAAAKAYDKAAKELFKEFSRLNFPEQDGVSAKCY